MENYLSDIEKEAIVTFYGNAVMREAVKKVLLFDVYNNGVLKPGEEAMPTRNFMLGLYFNNQGQEVSNEALGAELRAAAEGISTVENAFNKMKSITGAPVVKEPKVNVAR